MSPPDRPPRLAGWILDVCEGARGPGAIRGDLDEEYVRHVRPTRSWLRARAWYWGQVGRSAPRVAGAHLGRGLPDAGGALGRRAEDLGFASRALMRRPAFLGAAGAALALGVGANAAVFGVVHAVLLRPLPYAHADRLVRVHPDALFYTDVAEVYELARRVRAFDALVPWTRGLTLFTGGAEPEEVRGGRVGWNHFQMLGAAPVLGRAFGPDDAVGDGVDAIILSHRLWVRRFGGDPAVVGKQVEV